VPRRARIPRAGATRETPRRPRVPAAKQPNGVEYTPGPTTGRCLSSRLSSGITEGENFAAGDAVFDRLFDLLKHAANRVARHEDLRPDALSLVGRMLSCSKSFKESRHLKCGALPPDLGSTR
jgi:hypothetical protein